MKRTPEAMRRSLVRDQAEENRQAGWPFATRFETWPPRPTGATRGCYPSRNVCLSCNPMNASAACFLTQGSSGVCANLRSGHHAVAVRELRAGAVEAQRPRADTRVGGAKRRALHGAEHSSKLGCVMAARTTAEAKRGLRQLDDGEICFQDDASESRHNHVTRRATRTKTMDTTSGRQPDRWTVGRERPSRQRPGAKSAGER
jgi:hypothetical protein